MTPYELTIRADFEARGREAEAICRAIGIDPVDNRLRFDFFARCGLPADRVDDVVAPDELRRVLNLDRRGVLALRPGDYVAQAAASGVTTVRAARGMIADPDDEGAARVLAIFDAVAGPKASRARECEGATDRAAELFALYRRTFEGGDHVLAYQALADLVEHFKPRGVDVRALLDEAIEGVESGVFSDGATA